MTRACEDCRHCERYTDEDGDTRWRCTHPDHSAPLDWWWDGCISRSGRLMHHHRCPFSCHWEAMT